MHQKLILENIFLKALTNILASALLFYRISEHIMNKNFALELKVLLAKYDVDLVATTDKYSNEVHVAFVDSGVEDFSDEQCHLYVDRDYINVDLLETLIQEESFLNELDSDIKS